MSINETAAGSQPAAIPEHLIQMPMSRIDYSMNVNPHAGPHSLARLLANLPVEETVLPTLALPWQTLFVELINCPAHNRIQRFEELISAADHGASIRQAVFSMDPLAPLPESAKSNQTVREFPALLAPSLLQAIGNPIPVGNG